MKKLLRLRTEAAEWSDEHEAMQARLESAGIGRSNPVPEWIILERLVEDVEGGLAGVEVRRIPTLSSKPSRSAEHWADDGAVQESFLSEVHRERLAPGQRRITGNLRWFADFEYVNPDVLDRYEDMVRLDAETEDEAKTEAEKLAVAHHARVISVYREEESDDDEH